MHHSSGGGSSGGGFLHHGSGGGSSGGGSIGGLLWSVQRISGAYHKGPHERAGEDGQATVKSDDIYCSGHW